MRPTRIECQLRDASSRENQGTASCFASLMCVILGGVLLYFLIVYFTRDHSHPVMYRQFVSGMAASVKNETPPSGKVHEIKEGDQLAQVMETCKAKKTDCVFVIHAPWCPHCQTLVSALKQYLSETDLPPQLDLVMIESGKVPDELLRALNVEYFPDVRLVKYKDGDTKPIQPSQGKSLWQTMKALFDSFARPGPAAESDPMTSSKRAVMLPYF